MALEIVRRPGPPALSGLIADRRLCVTADRTRAVEERDPDAAFLLVAAGHGISAADVDRYRLVRGADGRILIDPPAPDPAPKAPARGAKAPKPDADD